MADQNNQIRIEKFSLLPDAMDDSLHRAFSHYESKNPQYGDSWLANLASHALDKHDTAVVYVARLGAENFVALPLKLNSRHRRVHSLSTFYTSAYSPVIHSDQPDLLFAALFRYLAKTENMSMLTLAPMAAGSPAFGHIQRALQQGGWRGGHDFFCFGNWIHNVEDHSFQSYLSSRPANVRNTIARKTRKFFDAGRGQVEVFQGGDGLDSATARYIAVYNNSWKNEEPYREFIPALLQLAASRGWLRLGIASYDHRPVASQVWLVAGDTAYIFKLAYDEDYKHLSPGTVLTAQMMQRAIEEDRVRCIDYLSGDDAYKADWMSERREQCGIAAYNPCSLDGLVMLTGFAVKRCLKKLWVS